MWQRFDESARKVLFYAQKEAQCLSTNVVEPEHLLLAVLSEDNVATQILVKMGIDLDALRSEFKKALKSGTGVKPEMTLSVHGKKVIDFAYEEAREIQDNDIGTEHLLLGLLRVRDEYPGQVLDYLKITPEDTREAIKLYRRPIAERKQNPAEGKAGTWQRFTEHARKVIFYAQEEAGKLGTKQVAPEHLLLGLMHEQDNVALRILDRLSVNRDNVRTAILERITPDSNTHVLGLNLQLTAESKRVIDLAYDASRRLNNSYIGTEHLLLGLICEKSSLAAQVLIELGATLERTRAETTLMQSRQ